jgi:hypothetical protein
VFARLSCSGKVGKTKALLHPETEDWSLIMLSMALCISGVKDELPLACSYRESVSGSTASLLGCFGRWYC